MIRLIRPIGADIIRSERPIIANTMRSNLNTQIQRIRMQSHHAPIFANLQVRSGIVIREMLDSGAFRDPDTIASQMAGLMSRVASGLEGGGTRSASVNRCLSPALPQISAIIFGPTVHITQDIGGGLDDTLRQHGRLPDSEDQREMYAAVRASMITLARDLRAQVGINFTTTGIELHERGIQATGYDVIQMLRDRQYRNRGGILDSLGIPPSTENIVLATQIIQNDPISLEEIVPGWSGDNDGSNV